jgi:hypothetical protein
MFLPYNAVFIAFFVRLNRLSRAATFNHWTCKWIEVVGESLASLRARQRRVAQGGDLDRIRHNTFEQHAGFLPLGAVRDDGGMIPVFSQVYGPVRLGQSVFELTYLRFDGHEQNHSKGDHEEHP